MTSQDRYPVRIKVYGGSLGLLPPGTVWRVERITEHVAPGGLIGEVMPEWTIIDLSPAEAATPAASGDALREALTVALIEAEADDQIGPEYTPDRLADYLADKITATRASREGA
jgi:hypothetical protein